jgi:hypothetical protein
MEIRVINTRATFLTTPKVGKPGGKGYFPARRLGPGGNNLDAAHVAALDQLDPKVGAGKVWADWKKLQFVRVLSPQESAKAVAKPEGPEAPLDLTERKLEAALAIISVETDPGILQSWFARDRRKEVRETIKVRLAQLEGRSASAPQE